MAIIHACNSLLNRQEDGKAGRKVILLLVFPVRIKPNRTL